ncbi:MAG: hypothetical protein HZB99_00735 [Candidatus Harrisonbacteria bacterium]|nr:hypothetical protein [Candidatus Harrisonbacteria bacterium]
MKKKKTKHKPWVCDECKIDKSGANCVEPNHCEISLENKRAHADLLLDQAKEEGIL